MKKWAILLAAAMALHSPTNGYAESVTEAVTESVTENMTESITERAGERKPEKDIAGDALFAMLDTYLAPRRAMGEEWAVSIDDLGREKIYEQHAYKAMQSASVIKVFIMGAVYDRILAPASPDKQIHYEESYTGELSSLMDQMITVSDNAAANQLIRILGEGDAAAGEQTVNDFCQEHGYSATSVGRLFLESNPTGDNYTSAADCRKILVDIVQGELVSAKACEEMLARLKAQTVTYKIPAGLPEGYSSANKTGEMPLGYGLGCIENDIAIVYSPYGEYVLCILSNNLEGRNQEAQQLISSLSHEVAVWQAGGSALG